MNTPLISFAGFGFQYRAQAKPTLYDIDLEIRKGEKILIAGPSGCGKTTTLRMIAGFLNPDERLTPKKIFANILRWCGEK